jgi:hypothetical protein
MTRLCGRPGCSESGAVMYGMVPEDLLFWVAPWDPAADSQDGVLCRRHADAMVVPRGWTLDDRREPVPRLFRPAPDPVPAESAPVRRVRRPTPKEPQLELGNEPGSEPDSALWAPRFDTEDDLEGLLEVRSPLLARAFLGDLRPPR